MDRAALTSSCELVQQKSVAHFRKSYVRKKSDLTLWSPEAITVPHRIIWSWYTGRWWVGCYISYSEAGTGRGHSLPRPLLAVPNVTARPSTASVPTVVLLYNSPLLWHSKGQIKISFTFWRIWFLGQSELWRRVVSLLSVSVARHNHPFCYSAT